MAEKTRTNVYTLDKLRADIDKEYSPIRLTLSDGEAIVLRSILRLGEKDRKFVLDQLKLLEEATTTPEPTGNQEEDDAAGNERFDKLTTATSGIIEKIAQKGKAKKLLADLDGDIPLTMRILSTWIEATSPGEAEPSPA